MTKLQTVRLAIGLAAISLVTQVASASALTYNIARNFTDQYIGNSKTASLTGTIDIPLGSYTITNRGATPFTNVNLALNIDGASNQLTEVSTNGINGSASFNITATETSLIFAQMNTDRENSAVLRFYSKTDPFSYYKIGSDYHSPYEFAKIGNTLVEADTNQPTTFNTEAAAVPFEFSPLQGVVLGVPLFMGLRSLKKRKARFARVTTDKNLLA